MRAAPSVLIFTVTAGFGQGLFVALILTQILAGPLDHQQLALGGMLSAGLLVVGLLASFFHLGHPLRAWRATHMWRTSWLSREVIVLPLTIAVICAWSVVQWFQLPGSTALAITALILTGLLWLCTAMIYACLRFLQEWAHPITTVNFVLIGLASGCTLNAFFWSLTRTDLLGVTLAPALGCMLVASAARVWSLRRNATLKAKSTLQSALGIKHPQITQKAQGASAGSFNTREYFHGKSMAFVVRARAIMLTLGFALPGLLCLLAWWSDSRLLLGLAIPVQYFGLLVERWVFFAQAKHPQNLYYQVVS